MGHEFDILLLLLHPNHLQLLPEQSLEFLLQAERERQPAHVARIATLKYNKSFKLDLSMKVNLFTKHYYLNTAHRLPNCLTFYHFHLPLTTNRRAKRSCLKMHYLIDIDSYLVQRLIVA